MNINHLVSVLIADDHDVYRDGLSGLLGKMDGITFAGEAANGKQLVQLASRLKPDIILTDLKMPGMGGIEAIREITALKLPCACIALTNFDSDGLITDALEAGARGYIQKTANKKEILEAIEAVYAGKVYYCRSTSVSMMKIIARSRFQPGKEATPDMFSEREKQVISMICRERSNVEIGQALFLSPRSVERIRTATYDKMNVKGPAGVVIYALRNNLYFID